MLAKKWQKMPKRPRNRYIISGKNCIEISKKILLNSKIYLCHYILCLKKKYATKIMLGGNFLAT